MTTEAPKPEQSETAGSAASGVERLVMRLREAANNASLEIGDAWNMLDEAADELERQQIRIIAAEKLCRAYFEIALSAGLKEEEIREKRKELFGA